MVLLAILIYLFLGMIVRQAMIRLYSDEYPKQVIKDCAHIVVPFWPLILFTIALVRTIKAIDRLLAKLFGNK